MMDKVRNYIAELLSYFDGYKWGAKLIVTHPNGSKSTDPDTGPVYYSEHEAMKALKIKIESLTDEH